MTRTEEEVIEEEVIQPDEDVQVLPDNNETIDRHELELSLLREQLDTLLSDRKEVDLPLGSILAYTGRIEDIPLKWALCDGTNGTVDLLDKFIMGSALDDLETVGGSADAIVVTHKHKIDHGHAADPHTHSSSGGSHDHGMTHDHGNTEDVSGGTLLDNMTWNGGQWAIDTFNGTNLGPSVIPSTSFNATPIVIDPHSHEVNPYYGNSDEATVSVDIDDTTVQIDDHTGDSTEEGEEGTGKNLPPYMKLAYIQRI